MSESEDDDEDKDTVFIIHEPLSLISSLCINRLQTPPDKVMEAVLVREN